ncbi:MAG: hypothetical protein K8T90_12805 [Planctomycetes bacterium]|nr:hypothetical protein [Planctomycetota bacterium]
MSETAQNDYPRRILEQLLWLRAAKAFDPKETAPGRGVWRWQFRAAGWPVVIDLDTSVHEIRVYHDRDEVAMAPVTTKLMAILLGGDLPPDTGEKVPSPDASIQELRKIVEHWKAGNARIFIRPPMKVGHADHGNRA